jgi:hypothetical protein
MIGPSYNEIKNIIEKIENKKNIFSHYIMPGLMNGSKRARHTPSITNNTKIFGIMGGLGPRVGVTNVGVYRHILIKAGQGLADLYGLTPAQQERKMKERNILSRNPLGSGGVGKKSLIFSGSRSGYVA